MIPGGEVVEDQPYGGDDPYRQRRDRPGGEDDGGIIEGEIER